MNYNPGISNRADAWIAQGNQNWARIAEGLVGYLINRGNQAKSLRAQVESLAGGDQPAGGGDQAAGFNPTTPAAGGGSGGGEDEGPSPAAQRGMQAEAMRKLMKSYAPEAKDLHQAVKAMSVDQLEGMLKGYTMKQAAGEHAARMEDYQAQARLRDQQALDDQTVGRLVKAYGTYSAGEGETAAPGERMQYALQQVPEAGGRVLPKAIEALTRYEQLLNPKAGEDLQAGFEQDPVTGARFYHRGKTSMSSGFDPAVTQQQEPQAHFDDDGKLTGFSTWDTKKGWVFKQAKDTGLKRAVLDDGTAVPGFVLSADGKMHDMRSAMEKAFGTAPATGAAGATTYKSAAEVKAAVDAGKLKKDEALKILRGQFGFK